MSFQQLKCYVVCFCSQSAFCQIALAFRCDQYTLKQRLQAEEHARNLAEENIQLELTRGRETLEVQCVTNDLKWDTREHGRMCACVCFQTLRGLCLDSKRSKMVQRLQLSLDILSGTVERISNTAEVLGAVHQVIRDLCFIHGWLSQVYMNILCCNNCSKEIETQIWNYILIRIISNPEHFCSLLGNLKPHISFKQKNNIYTEQGLWSFVLFASVNRTNDGRKQNLF